MATRAPDQAPARLSTAIVNNRWRACSESPFALVLRLADVAGGVSAIEVVNDAESGFLRSAKVRSELIGSERLK